MTIALRFGQFSSRLRFRFRHASADRVATDNIIVEAGDEAGLQGYGEGCPRDYVTGETAASARRFLDAQGSEIARRGTSLDRLKGWIADRESLIDDNPAAFAAVELALIDLMGKRAARPVEALLGLDPLSDAASYSAILGDSASGKIRLMSAAYALCGFSDFKVKLSGDAKRDRDRFRALPRRLRLRVDANNHWRSAADCVAHLRDLERPIWAIEEPLAAGDVAGMRTVAKETGAKIVLDESLVRRGQLGDYAADPELWIANIRVSKCGGLLRSIDLAREAQAAGLDVILGAHVGETSLLTRAALTVGKALERAPVAREGAFGEILLKRDLASPSLRFSRNGALDPRRYGLDERPGLGLSVLPDRVSWSS